MYTTSQKMEFESWNLPVDELFWKKSLMLTKAAFI